jgi:hypothetical protein
VSVGCRGAERRGERFFALNCIFRPLAVFRLFCFCLLLQDLLQRCARGGATACQGPQVLAPLYVIIEYRVTPLLLLLRVCPPPGYLGASSAHSLAAFLLQRLRPRLPHCVRLGLHLPRVHTRGRGKRGGDGRTRAYEVSAGA